MADLGYLNSIVNTLPQEMRKPILDIVTAIVKDIRFGHPQGEQPDPMTNIGGGFFHGTTPATPGDEFSIEHGFGRIPYLALPVLRLDAVGSSVVPVTVARAADVKRIYLTSTIANAPVSFAVEG